MIQPPSPQGSALPLLPSHFWEGSLALTRRAEKLALILKLQELPSRCQGENLEEAQNGSFLEAGGVDIVCLMNNLGKSLLGRKTQEAKGADTPVPSPGRRQWGHQGAA